MLHPLKTLKILKTLGSSNDTGKLMATILVADDDQKLLKMVRRTLIYEGISGGDRREWA